MKLGRFRRLGWLSLVAVVVISAVVGYIEFYLARPIGEGPAGPAVDQAFFRQVWSDEPIQVVGLGDSITAGLGAKSPRHTFFNRMLQNPSDEYADMMGVCLSVVLPQLEHENFAISGSDSCAHLETIRHRVPDYPDRFGLVFMTSGGNDLIHNYGRSTPRECAMYGASITEADEWVARFRHRLSEMLDAISAKFPLGCEIYIGDIYDPTDGVGDAPSVFLPPWPDGLAIHARYNETIRDVASEKQNVFVVPLHQTFLGHGSHCRQFWRPTYVRDDPHYWFFTNIEDPNDRGYDAIRRIFLKTLLENSRLVPRLQSARR